MFFDEIELFDEIDDGLTEEELAVFNAALDKYVEDKRREQRRRIVKRVLVALAIVMAVVVFITMTASPVDAAKKHSKKSSKVGMKVVSKKTKKVNKMTVDIKNKVVTIHCPVCGDGTHEDCPYWCGFNNGTEYRHMTDKEIEDFLWSESHYQTGDGEWHVR